MTFKPTLASIFTALGLLTLITSCGAKQSTKNNSSHKFERAKESLEGKYQAKLFTVNSSVSGLSSGLAKIHLIADSISVEIDMRNVPAHTHHAQQIYTATECPKNSHDINDDGFIDPLEASKVLGPIIIPLDGDLNSQIEGMNESPIANAIGDYHYYKEGAISSLMDDLTNPDLNPQDDVIKLLPHQDLSLVGKVIVIQGVSLDVYLPGSIRALEHKSEYSSLAIACGKIERVINDETSTSGSED